MAGTSLAVQLKRLAAPQTSILVHTKKRASLLFDPKDAADIDRDSFYKIGLNGLEELKAIDPRFGEFDKSLFDETSLQLVRSVEDRQANAKLDQLINRYLILLSPYLNLKAAQKTLEWLICRFQIHQYNTDSVMALFLPYHDTNIFARMVQILPLEGRWIWLQSLKKEGIPMSKLFLLSRASSDTSFFKFICNLPLQGVQVHGEKSGCLTTLFAFYCTTVIGALDQALPVSEVQVSHLLPSLIAGINSSHLDFTASSFMILGHLVTKIRLTPGIFSELFYKVSRCDQAGLRTEAALVLVVMAQCNFSRLPSLLPALTHLATTTWFFPSLSSLAQSGVVVFPLVATFLSDCLTALKQQENIQHDLLQDFLTKLLKDLAFNKEEAEKLLILLAETPLTANEWYNSVVHQLEKSYPEAFDKVARSHSNLFPGYTARNDLFVRLNHPESRIRLQAVLHIKSQKELLKEEWVQQGLLIRLTDDSVAVVAEVLKLSGSLPKAQLRDALVSVVVRCWHSKGMNTLAPLALDRLHKYAHVDQTLLLLLSLPFLLPMPTDATELATAKAVLNCNAAKGSQIFEPLLKKLGDNISEGSLSKEVYKFIGKNLKDVKVSELLKAMSRLEAEGTVYQLLGMMVAAGALPAELSDATLEPLLQRLQKYNSFDAIESEKNKELNEKTFGSIVSVCRSRKLPYQGSLHLMVALSQRLMSQLKAIANQRILDIGQSSVALFIHVFRLALQAVQSKNVNVSKAYSNFCDSMIEMCTETDGQIDLLCSIVLGCKDLAADCLLRVRHLVDELTTIREDVLVPALLVGLGSPDDRTRQNALALLNSLTQKLALPTYHQLLHHLAESSHEITVDSEQVNVALYMCLSPDPSVQALLSKTVRQDMTKVLNTLLNIVTAPNTPSYIRASLLKLLDQVNSQSILEKLVPLALKILASDQALVDEMCVLKAIISRVNVTTASAFKDTCVWRLVGACFANQKTQHAAMMLLQQIEGDLFAALNAENQHRLLSLIVNYVAEVDHSDVTSAAASSMKRVTLDAATIAALLEPMRDATVDDPLVTKKRGWTVKKPPPLELLITSAWRQGLCLLEFIQNKKKLDNVQVLLPRLFEILSRCLQFEEQSPVEYTKQVILTSLLHCCGKLSTDGSPVDVPESHIQVELVVECIRVSANPQTHHHALLLLAHVANMIPERVLHSIMPIFTFMGSSILRQDDAYSFQIISKVLETIVPILIKSASKREEEELTPEVVGVLRVFAGALLDIPEHRRTPLFTKLVTSLHDGHLLWAFLSLVFESHVLHPDTSTVKEAGSIPKRLEVGLQLCHQFPPGTVLLAACRLVHYLCALPTDKGDKKVQVFKKSRLGALFDIERASEKQLRHYTYTTLTFLSLLLSSKQFLRLMAALTSDEVQELKDIFERMFEGILKYTQIAWKLVEQTSGQVTSKYWKSMFNICFDVLAKTNALLPGDMFLSVIAGLLDHELISLRCKALELLNWRLQQGRPMDTTQLLSLLPALLRLIKTSDQSNTESQVMQQTALLSVKFLARQLAAENPQEFQQVFKAATKLVKHRTVSEPVLASALLCVGELCHSLGAHAITALSTFMPPIIAILENHKLISSGDLVLVSLVSALFKIVDSLACFLSPYMDQLLLHLAVLSADCSQHTDNPKMQPVLQKIKAIRLKISGEVPLRVLLPGIAESYSRLVKDSQTAAIPHLLAVLTDSFKRGTPLSPELANFFLSALDFRSQATSAEDICTVEPAVISMILALVLKLSESSFRPFYYKIFNWAFRSETHKDRAITFYKLTCSIAESLKGLFVSFAHYFLNNAASLLNEHNTSKQDESWESTKAEELVDAVLRALLTVFLHDASHFVTKERFDTLMQPIVDQLENELGGEEHMTQRVADLVTPCLAQMAACAADDTLWKQLNYQILLKTRHNLPQVRIGGVLTVCEIAKKLGEEFLPLLPETVPFLAELLEDENEQVEKISQRVVQELEIALGEPISKYF